MEKIASIKILEPQHVYDLAIEDTRNFIANDIVAHNTYFGDSTSDVATLSGNFSVDSPTFFVDSISDRIGIGFEEIKKAQKPINDKELAKIEKTKIEGFNLKLGKSKSN